MLSLVIPVYRNELNLPHLLPALVDLASKLPEELEIVFVVDGSPDACFAILERELPMLPLHTRLMSLSRNFGSFAAITAGLQEGTGEYFAVLAADLQEPPELVAEFLRILRADEADVVFGWRRTRQDPWLTELASGLFWRLYRSFVLPEIPASGVDVFGCTRRVRDHLLTLPETNTNLIALLFWLGFRRAYVPYDRQPRRDGISAWTFAKKMEYAFNSIFQFTDLPVRLLLGIGIGGVVLSVALGTIVLVARLAHMIKVLGYTPLVLLILFFGGMTTFGLGILGQYVWLTLQNARRRPPFIVASRSAVYGHVESRRS